MYSEIVKKYQDIFPRISIVQGGAPAKGRNNGGRTSVGDPIFFIDADVIIPASNLLQIAVKYFRKNKLAVATAYLKPESQKWIDHFLVKTYNKILFLAKFIRPLGAMYIVVSREAFEKSGGYPEDVVMAEDHDFVLRCLKYGPYDILPLDVLFSVRRLEKEGRMGLLLKYLKAALYRIFVGPITKPIFKYEFGYSEDKDKPDKEFYGR